MANRDDGKIQGAGSISRCHTKGGEESVSRSTIFTRSSDSSVVPRGVALDLGEAHGHGQVRLAAWTQAVSPLVDAPWVFGAGRDWGRDCSSIVLGRNDPALCLKQRSPRTWPASVLL